jgi:hypothetical protein
VIVYVLTDNEKHEGGTVAGVYSTEEKAREEATRRGPAQPPFYWAIVPVEVDGPSGDPKMILVD